jgi:hypothetical protein
MTHLRQNCLVFVHGIVWQLNSGGLRNLFLFLLFILLLWLGDQAPRLLVAREASLEDAFDQVICTQDVTGLRILDHPIRKSGNMARRLEHWRGRHDGGIDLEHVVFHDEVFTPFCDDVRLK